MQASATAHQRASVIEKAGAQPSQRQRVQHSWATDKKGACLRSVWQHDHAERLAAHGQQAVSTLASVLTCTVDPRSSAKVLRSGQGAHRC
jgi:hypothetical protein